jgi:hypothetical protein
MGCRYRLPRLRAAHRWRQRVSPTGTVAEADDDERVWCTVWWPTGPDALYRL